MYYIFVQLKLSELVSNRALEYNQLRTCHQLVVIMFRLKKVLVTFQHNDSHCTIVLVLASPDITVPDKKITLKSSYSIILSLVHSYGT